MDVDMAATVIVASHAKADELGVPAERRAYLHGWCYATDPVYVAEHPDLSASPAMAAASAEALRAARGDDRRRGPPRPLQLLRQLGAPGLRRPRHRPRRSPRPHRHRRAARSRAGPGRTTCCTASRPWSTCSAADPGTLGLV